jgi:hypothetical protein
VVIASPVHASICATACPPKCLLPVFVELLFVAAEFDLEFATVVVYLLFDNVTPPSSILRARPSDKFQPAFVLFPVPAFTVLIIPNAGRFLAVSFVCRPVSVLACFPLNKNRMSDFRGRSTEF